MNNHLSPVERAVRRRELNGLSRDPAALELAAICREMEKLQERIGDFREAHHACRTSGRGRCLLCVEFFDLRDFSGTDPFGLLSAAQTMLSVAGSLIDNDRPFTDTEDETEEALAVAGAPVAAAGKAGEM